MLEFTPEVKKRYLENDGMECAFCEEGEAENNSISYGERQQIACNQISVPCTCKKCGEHWTEFYKLCDIEGVEGKEQPGTIPHKETEEK